MGHIFKTENLQPKAFRNSLIDAKEYFLTALVPVLRETYTANFNGAKRPKYCKNGQTWVKDEIIMGVLTSADPMPTGQIPPVTICEQLNDLRVDPNSNHVITYIFKALDPTKMQVSIDVKQEMDVIQTQRYEEAYRSKSSLKRNFSEAFNPNLK